LVIKAMKLSKPRHDGSFSVERALLERRSIRKYMGEPLTLQEVSQLLWAAQGMTDPRGLGTAPSAGALYPLEVYVAVGGVENLGEGVYKYRPQEHCLIKTLDGDKRGELSASALDQNCVREAAIDIGIAAVYERTTSRYGDRGIRYVHIEAGHVSQNVYLQATAMGLGTVAIGAFHDELVKKVLGLREDEWPLYLMPVGKKPCKQGEHAGRR
jgi:SagB-type dehydrogenase family enzyme